MPRLLVIRGVDEGRQFELAGPMLGIGRDTTNAVHLHDTEVSRRHAEFRQTLDGSGYRLYDRGSVNGVFVNGQPAKDVLLQAGDQIQIGQTVLVYSAARESRGGDLAERIRMIARPDAELKDSIVRTVADTEGSRMLTRPDEVQSPWLRTRLENLAILYESSQAVNRIHEVDRLLDRILELIFRSIEADRGCILLLNAESGIMEPKAIRFRRQGKEEELTISRTITEHVLREREGVLVSDAAKDARFQAGQSIVRYGIREAICVPMRGRHETLGVLYLDALNVRKTPSAAFNEDHLSLAIALAHQAALALEETRHYQALVQAERLAAVGQTIAALSHHIKNILQGLRSGSEILNLGIRDKDDRLLRQGWKLVEKNQSKIYDLVLDMLSYSKEREPALERISLRKIVGEVVELVRPRAAELGATIKAKVPAKLPTLMADSEGVHRALLNLVGNALDAVDGRAEPTVEISVTKEDAEWIRVAVRDNGIGMAAETLAELFKPFVSSKGARGTGLGLAVSRKILREHGGDILVESTPDVGSMLTLRLPIRKEIVAETATHAPLPN